MTIVSRIGMWPHLPFELYIRLSPKRLPLTLEPLDCCIVFCLARECVWVLSP
jgi:hypothetical protein